MSNKWQVLYYSREDGSMPVKEYIDNLSLRERAKTMALKEHKSESCIFSVIKILLF